MPAALPPSTSLSITNPLILYRSLLASNRLRPDPAQHRLALHLQDLYFRLKDYNPELEYRQRLDQATRSVPRSPTHDRDGSQQRPPPTDASFSISSLFRNSSPSSILSLTRTIPIQESACMIQSPRGLLLHGEVGRGKSMLLDLIYQSLPSSKKRRYHFTTFMLDIFRRIERERISRLAVQPGVEMEHVVLSLARESIGTHPILFLDEFQLPDRASSKLLSSFMTSFFHLGGVLVASSNRMPEELAKAQGIEFAAAPSRFDWKGGYSRWSKRSSEGERAAQGDFGLFLEVLKARCDVWEMEGMKDWRREDGDENAVAGGKEEAITGLDDSVEVADRVITTSKAISDSPEPRLSDAPAHYHITTLTTPSTPSTWSGTISSLNATQTWTPSTLRVYGRNLLIPQTSLAPPGIQLWTFSTLCATNLGPADYVSIASAAHTLIITEVPVLTSVLKNEARRFITLLDALYEAKCRLLIRAAAPPDKLFFPETRSKSGSKMLGDERLAEDDDSVYQESFSEIYQDQTAPFRPNISSYIEKDASSAPSSSLLNKSLRSVLADEDADFGPTYGNGRSHGASTVDASFADLSRREGPDFTKTSQLTGDDERFAYKRARSRLWEMCGRRWWKEREGDPAEWWMPVHTNERLWEVSPQVAGRGKAEAGVGGSHDGSSGKIDTEVQGGKEEGLFRHGASPFRTRMDPPPKFGWQHAWGMTQWGRKAGEWGKGVEGDRGKEREERKEVDMGRRGKGR